MPANRFTPPPDPCASGAHDEEERIAARRAIAGVEKTAPLCGLALSGGGLRSATFCLGLIRALAKNRVLTRVDVLSTVSGGGYTGGMLGRLYQNKNARRVQERLAADDTLLLWWLRNNGRCLTPAGARDIQMSGAQILRAFVLNTALVIWLALLIALPALLVTTKNSGFAMLLHQLLVVSLSAAGVAALHYWMTHSLRGYFIASALLLAAGGYWLLNLASLSGAAASVPERPLFWLLAALALYSLLLMAYAWRCRHAPSRWRLGLSWHLRFCLMCFLLPALLWALGTLSREIHPYLPTLRHCVIWLAVVLAGGKLIALGAIIAKLPARKGLMVRLSVSRTAWPNLAGCLLMLALLVLVANALLAAGNDGPGLPTLYRLLPTSPLLSPQRLAFVLWLAAFVALCLLRFMPGLLNLSSLHHFYRARIERAWLSPGNYQGEQRRFDRDPLDKKTDEAALRVRKITSALAGDDSELKAYQPHAHGGPVHLINCCLNQTTDESTGGYIADRKGIALTVSSHGVEYGSRRAGPDNGAPPGTLSQWLAISGAAVSAGTGSRTSPGAALLIFLFGARLGFWHPSLLAKNHPLRQAKAHGLWRAWRYLTAPPGYLLSEMLARFAGPGKEYWFLTDGGHIENTGAYALLKRRLPLIVLADCGADPDYLWDDLENLVRKARIDLHTDIEFDDNPPAPFGTLAHFSRDAGSPLLLARLRYPEGETGALIVVKPRRLANAALDTAAYARRNPGFPHLSTTDQFFDEEQWEAYHQCGLLAGAPVDDALLEKALNAARAACGQAKKSADEPRKG